MIFTALTHAREWAWMKERTHVIACEDSQGIVAYGGYGKIVGCVIADSFSVDACSVHIAIDSPLVVRAGFFDAVAYHLFITCGRERLFGMVPDDNPRALKFDLKIGFKVVTKIPDTLQAGIGYTIVRMDKADCRWLPQELKEAA